MNATQTAQSLLSLPSGVSAPDPYTVLGLTPGESDNVRIATALKSVVARLNGVKASADPMAWNQAATWVKEARRVVSDPVLKTQLDQKLAGRSTLAPPPPNTAPNISAPSKSPLQSTPLQATPTFDPLAGLLPGQAATARPTAGLAQPFSGPSVHVDTRNTAFRAGNVPPPPGIPQPPAPYAVPPAGHSWPQSGAGDVGIETARELEAIGKPKSPGRRRRKRFPWASLILVALTLASIGGIVGMVVYLNKNPSGITIALQPGVGGAAAVDGSDFAVAPPAKRDDSPPDPVMGRLSPAKSERRTDRKPTAEAADNWLADLPHNGLTDGGDDAPMAADNPAMTPATDAMPDAAAVTDPTAEQLETAQAALLKARQVLATAQWDQMNAAAAAAVQAAVTQDDKKTAIQFVQLAELATYYHIGVEQALDGLKATETFNVTEQIEVAVVEITPAKVTLKFNGRNKDYARSELPLVVAHKIAGFTLPIDAPATKTAAQVYQTLAPVTTPQYREQAIKTLEAMPPQPDEVNPAELVAAIRQVFPE